jgi:sec-independent protein translocase protein TatA
MFQNIGTTELLIIAFILILLFGGKKIPELIRALGDSIKEFRTASKDEEPKKKEE